MYTEPVMRRLIASVLLASAVLAACHSGRNASSSADFKVYKLRGKVVATDAAKGEITVDQEAIAGFMDAMTMTYKLKNPGMMGALHPGDVITADLLVPRAADAEMLLDHIVVVGQSKPDSTPTAFHYTPVQSALLGRAKFFDAGNLHSAGEPGPLPAALTGA